jgi:hypothetical protein
LKRASLLVVAAMVVVVLPACSGKGSAPKPPSAAPTDAPDISLPNDQHASRSFNLTLGAGPQVYCHNYATEQPGMSVYLPGEGSLPSAPPESTYWQAGLADWDGNQWVWDGYFTDWWSPRPPTATGLAVGVTWINLRTHGQIYGGAGFAALDTVYLNANHRQYYTWFHRWFYNSTTTDWVWFGNTEYNSDIDAYQGWCQFQ